MVKMRRVIRALERPAECREEGGGREDGSWMVTVDSDGWRWLWLEFCLCFVIDLTLLSCAAAGAQWEGIPYLDGQEEGRRTSGSEPDKEIIELWRLG